MPGKVNAKQALHLAEALARGTPDRKKIMQTIFEDRVRELV
jgi:pyruvate dehydrogenase (quinone)/pyruvate oxidase